MGELFVVWFRLFCCTCEKTQRRACMHVYTRVYVMLWLLLLTMSVVHMKMFAVRLCRFD